MPPSPRAFESVALGCLGSPSSSGPSAFCSESQSCQDPRGGHAEPVAVVVTGAALLLPLGTLRRCPPCTFLWNEGSAVRHSPPCMLHWVSLSSFPIVKGLLASAAPSCRQWPGDPGSCIGPQDRRRGCKSPTAHLFLNPAPLHCSHTQLEPSSYGWVLSTSRAGGRIAVLGLCLKPRGSLLLPPPALPEPGPCAACPPSPFVPEEGGGGRPTVPKAGHQP